MKLSISTDSVNVLNEFAEKIPTVLENIYNDTQNLLNQYYNLADTVGPHNTQFEEMLQIVRNSQDNSSLAIKELSYMLKATADKMESYIQHGSGATTVLAGSTFDIKQKYSSAVCKRLSQDGTNEIIKEFFDEYSSQVRIVDHDYMGTPFYNSMSKGIKLNAMADMHNPIGSCSTYFHEVGHMLDDLAGNGHAWLSSDPEYKQCLVRDVEAYIQKTMITAHCEMQEAYDIISDELFGDWNAGVSDIFGSLTNCRCQGDWGHHYTYWQQDDSRVVKEAFANMFEASIGSKSKQEAMKKYFPSAYSKFEQIVRRRYR